jgi:anti-sigma-K factor RskA
LAAALVIAIGGLYAWNITLRNRLDDRLDASRATAVAPLQGAGAGGGTVLYFADRHKAVVIGADMPAPDAGKTYQLWAVGDDGQPKSIGLMQPDAAGRTNAVVDFDRDATGTLAITVEPAGGSDQPTSAPVFTAKV